MEDRDEGVVVAMVLHGNKDGEDGQVPGRSVGAGAPIWEGDCFIVFFVEEQAVLGTTLTYGVNLNLNLNPTDRDWDWEWELITRV